ncbi:DNA-binding response regulator [Taibaiella sp. KBW10]|uniref:response regulator n=1 Tax=Taibaiella sp. KBW10 TaxID=2153357 RepID=UPI000F59A90D|nr:response regulator transcription factor [Taibaiella sp. KBW10]RQO31045.1 DNA-binding response regulator [Taibaiella sp. KBW10]
MKKTRVSIIEDNTVFRDTLMQYISLQEEFELGVRFSAVRPFLDELMGRYEGQTHILLLDVGLPDISGLEAIPLIIEKMPDINIVMLTTYEEEDVILKALCSGACSYISKTASMSDIVSALYIVGEGGSYMSPSIAREIVTYLMGGRVSKATILTSRQREILQRLVDGKTYDVIGTELFVSVETVRSHVKKMYKILQVNNKTEAIAKYMRGEIN